MAFDAVPVNMDKPGYPTEHIIDADFDVGDGRKKELYEKQSDMITSIFDSMNCIKRCDSRLIHGDNDVYATKRIMYVEGLKDERARFVAITEELQQMGAQPLPISSALDEEMASILNMPLLATIAGPPQVAALPAAVVGDEGAPAVHVLAN